jgi:hypothetical protein
MRILIAMALACVASCASEKLAQAPPAGVDLTGHWKLNEADSDDPQRLVLAQNAAASQNSAPGGSSGGGGGGGRGGRGGGRGGAGALGTGGPGGPAMPSASAMAEGLRWPGKKLEIKQVAGVVAFTSDGNSVVCQPMDGGHHGHHGEGADRDGDSSRRDAPSRSRDAPPPRCGWVEKILIVENRESEDEHPPFEEHFGLSDDSRRLVEVVDFKGGRSSGFTMSRVWDRVDQ